MRTYYWQMHSVPNRQSVKIVFLTFLIELSKDWMSIQMHIVRIIESLIRYTVRISRLIKLSIEMNFYVYINVNGMISSSQN